VLAQKIDKEKSRFKDYLPACVKCEKYIPSPTLDPFDGEVKCAEHGEIPIAYLLMDEACNKLFIDEEKAFMDVGQRPLTMLERWAQDR